MPPLQVNYSLIKYTPPLLGVDKFARVERRFLDRGQVLATK